MAMPALTPRRWTAREVRGLIAANPLHTPRYELVDGELLLTPSPSNAHQDAVFQFAKALDAYLRTGPLGRAKIAPFDVELESESVVQPDIFVVPLEEDARLRVEDGPARRLLVAVEIVSPSSARHDRVTKRRFFQRVRVPEYWVVDTDARTVERWRSGDGRT